MPNSCTIKHYPEAMRNMRQFNEILKARCLSPSEISRQSDLSMWRIGEYMRGQNTPMIRSYNALAGVLGWKKITEPPHVSSTPTVELPKPQKRHERAIPHSEEREYTVVLPKYSIHGKEFVFTEGEHYIMASADKLNKDQNFIL